METSFAVFHVHLLSSFIGMAHVAPIATLLLAKGLQITEASVTIFVQEVNLCIGMESATAHAHLLFLQERKRARAIAITLAVQVNFCIGMAPVRRVVQLP